MVVVVVVVVNISTVTVNSANQMMFSVLTIAGLEVSVNDGYERLVVQVVHP